MALRPVDHPALETPTEYKNKFGEGGRSRELRQHRAPAMVCSSAGIFLLLNYGVQFVFHKFCTSTSSAFKTGSSGEDFKQTKVPEKNPS